MQNNFFHIGDETAEYAYTVQSICQRAQCQSKDIQAIRGNSVLGQLLSRTVKKQISLPIYVDIPKEMSPDDPSWAGRRVLTCHAIHLDTRRNLLDEAMGLTEHTLSTPQRDITIWRWQGWRDYYPLGHLLYFVKKQDMFSFYRAYKTMLRERDIEPEAPILPEGMLHEIYENTVGFLKKGKDLKHLFSKHHIPYKRGVLLAGHAGCGKTLTCKWLRHKAEKQGFKVKIVTLEDYRYAQGRNEVSRVFQMNHNERGLIFFDDMDVMVKDRNTGNQHLQTFLTELDGMNPKEGVVYIFTTNVIEELDDAFVRPGRIDLFLTFKYPTKQLRELFIRKRFSSEILAFVDIADVTERTEEYSYAELEEIRKLLTIDYLDGKTVDVDRTFKVFDIHRKEFQERSTFGFGQIQPTEEEDVYPYPSF